MDEQMYSQFKVFVKCLTYNHASYIKDALNGFTIQKTDFPFVCCVIDDASNDGEQNVIKEYLQEHFDLDNTSVVRNEETDDYYLTFAQHKTNQNCYFAVLFLKYNHYSIKKSKESYIQDWMDTKYVALCEGDDYWVSPEKLQRQINFLEAHPDYTMACNRTKLLSVKYNKFIGENYCYDKSQTVTVKDVIYRTGLFISTCSIIYRKEIKDNKPDYWKQCKVGDYPLQIMCAMKGKVFYFNDAMSVYRVQNSKSWMGRQKWGSVSIERLEIVKSRVEMLYGFSGAYHNYAQYFNNKIADEINRNIPSWRVEKEEIKYYLDYFSEYIKKYSFRWKIDLWIRTLRVPKVRYMYTRLFLKEYSQLKKMYKD